ncbi:MAG: biotin/lipoyl-binding protein, partial [Planctomycetaceae bacterium]|nr:biotin/lipoyl-binding protein [Planctomycetaceae bacterium]
EVPTQAVSDEPRAAVVETAEVRSWIGPFDLEVEGEAVTYRVVTVSSEVEGRVLKKTAAARGGTYVEKGDLLFEIDASNYELDVRRLEAQLQQVDEELNSIDVSQTNTQALIALAQEDWDLQKKQLERMQRLQDRRTANDTEVEAAMRQELSARNSLQSLKNQLATLIQDRRTKEASRALVDTQLARVRLDVQRCRIVSPIEGRIVDDVVEEGDYTKSAEVLVHISDGSRMEVKCQLRSEELAWVWQQTAVLPDMKKSESAGKDPVNLPAVPCEVVFEFEGMETIWDGHLARLEGTGIDRDTRTFPCRVLVEEPRRSRISDSHGGRVTVTPPALLSGMYVTIRIPVESPIPLVQVPLESVRPGGQLWMCRDGKLDVVNTTVATVHKLSALIRSDLGGVQPGERVVTSPLASVQTGMPLIDLNLTSPSDDAATSPVNEAPKVEVSP